MVETPTKSRHIPAEVPTNMPTEVPTETGHMTEHSPPVTDFQPLSFISMMDCWHAVTMSRWRAVMLLNCHDGLLSCWHVYMEVF